MRQSVRAFASAPVRQLCATLLPATWRPAYELADLSAGAVAVLGPPRVPHSKVTASTSSSRSTPAPPPPTATGTPKPPPPPPRPPKLPPLGDCPRSSSTWVGSSWALSLNRMCRRWECKPCASMGLGGLASVFRQHGFARRAARDDWRVGGGRTGLRASTEQLDAEDQVEWSTRAPGHIEKLAHAAIGGRTDQEGVLQAAEPRGHAGQDPADSTSGSGVPGPLCLRVQGHASRSP